MTLNDFFNKLAAGPAAEALKATAEQKKSDRKSITGKIQGSRWGGRNYKRHNKR